jgi:uncharacterized protein
MRTHASTSAATPRHEGVRRGRHNPRLLRIANAVLEAALWRGFVARCSYRLGLHGALRISQHRIPVASDGRLPAPLKVAFASDFHAGPTTHPELFSRLAQELSAHQPDVLLLGGDFVSTKAEPIEVLIECLSLCRPRLGTYAVLGNHDLWSDEAQITRALTAAGVHVLVNRNVALPAPFDAVSICGIDDPWTGSADIAKAFRGANEIRIFLTHSPDGLLLLEQERFDVGFAGHTHGGQVALPSGTPIVGAGGPLARSHSRGRFEVPGSGPLIVSRGVGCSNLPIRINADPELILCTLEGPA